MSRFLPITSLCQDCALWSKTSFTLPPPIYITTKQPSLSGDHIHVPRSSLTLKPDGSKAGHLRRSENVSLYWANIYLPWIIYITRDREMTAVDAAVNRNAWYWKKCGKLLLHNSNSRVTCQRGKHGIVFFECSFSLFFLFLSFNSHLNYLLGEEYKWDLVGPHESSVQWEIKQPCFKKQFN